MNVKLLQRVTELTGGMEFFECANPDMTPQLKYKIAQLAQGIADMNACVRKYRFATVEEEVVYFKEIKPRLVKEYVFLSALKAFYEKHSHFELQRSKI